MAREIKDELNSEPIEVEEQPQAFGGIQIPLTQKQEQELVDIVLEDFETAETARMEKGWGQNNKGEDMDFEGKYEFIVKKYEGQTEPPLKPWMSQGTTKIATAIVETIHSKLLPAVWNENLIGWKPVERTDKETVVRINRLMLWWVKVRMKFKLTVDDIIKYVCVMGTAITKDTWQVSKKDTGQTTPVQTTDEMGNPIAVVDETGNPLTNKVFDIKEKPVVELIPIDRFYIQPGQTDLQKEPVIHRSPIYYSELEDGESIGKYRNVTDKVKPSVDSILISKVDKTLQESERISISNVKRRNYPTDILEWYGPYDYDNDGFQEECVVTVEKESKTLISAIPLNAISMKSVRPFTKYDFIRRVLKFYGVGIIELVLPLAEECDACLRQIRDANTISIQRFGFYDPSGDYNPETHTLAPLKMYPVPDPQRSVYFPDISVPIERLIATMRLLLEFIERLTAASSYSMGKESDIVGGSGTATRTQAILMNADQRFDIPAQRLRESFAEQMTHLLHQVQLNMPQGMEKEILGEDGEPIFQDNEITPDRILAELDGYIEGDAGMGDRNTQRQLASFIYNTLLQNPLVATDPVKLYIITADLLESHGKNSEDILGPKPNLMEFDSAEDENTMIREGKLKDVRAHLMENHLEHITVHSLPLQTMDIKNWNPVTIQYLNGHIMEHQQMMNQMVQISQMGKGMSGQQQNQTNSENPNAPAGVSPSGTPDSTQNAPNQQQGATLNG